MSLSDPTLNDILKELVKLADDFDEECSRASRFRVNIEFSQGRWVQVDVDLLRQLREVVSDENLIHGHLPRYPPE